MRGRTQTRLKVEHLAEKRLLFLRFVAVRRVAPTVVVIVVSLPRTIVSPQHILRCRRGCRAGHHDRRWSSGGPLDDLVEFTSIKPHAATRRAIVDLDPGAVGHHEDGFGAGWTLHDWVSLGRYMEPKVSPGRRDRPFAAGPTGRADDSEETGYSPSTESLYLNSTSAIAGYEAEFGEISAEEIARQRRADRQSAAVVRGTRKRIARSKSA